MLDGSDALARSEASIAVSGLISSVQSGAPSSRRGICTPACSSHRAARSVCSALLDAGLAPVPASATGYCAGILVHWLISSRLVFADGAAARGTGERHRQKLLFVGSAIVGLAVTTAIVGGGSALGLDPRLAKLAAIVVSFQTTYLLRRHIVFRAASA